MIHDKWPIDSGEPALVGTQSGIDANVDTEMVENPSGLL